MDMLSVAAAADDSGARIAPSGRAPRASLILFVLCLVAIFNYVDRQVMSILLQPIKETFKVSDTLMGLLAGPVFAGCYAAAALPLAWVSDRHKRSRVLAACLAFWSLSTGLGGLAQSFWVLAMTRVGVAVAESGAIPASHAIISDLYPRNRRARAIAVLSSAQSIGLGVGLGLGGWLAQTFDWRIAFFLVGIPGLLLTLPLLRLPDVPRGYADGQRSDVAPLGFAATVRALWKIRTYRYLVLTIGMNSLPGYALLAWEPAYLLRVHHMRPGEIGALLGATVASALVIGNLLGGTLADRASGGDLRRYLWIAAAGPVIATPFLLGFSLTDNQGLLFVLLFIGLAATTTHLPPCYALGQSLVPSNVRATASVCMGLASVFVGAGLGPLIVGALNDAFTPQFGDHAVRYSLAVLAASSALTAIPALLGSRWVRRDFAAVAAVTVTAPAEPV